MAAMLRNHVRTVVSAFFALVLAVPFVDASAEQTWHEVRSPHFRVLTDGSEKDGRTVAFRFEQMRHVFVTLFQDEAIHTGPPLTVVAARNLDSFDLVEPPDVRARGENIAGLFHSGWEKQYAVLRLDSWKDQNEVVVYHEFAHSILHANTFWLPIWLDEGMAEFYAYTRLEPTRTLVGVPSARMRELYHKALLPTETMLNVGFRSPNYTDPQQVQLFYAEAWAMVHYMMFGPGMQSGDKLVDFVRRLQRREPQEQAFREVFGDPKAFDVGLDQYTSRYLFTAGVIPADQKIDPKAFSERVLTPAETQYEIGCTQIATGDRKDGRAAMEKAVQLDGTLAGAHEELGYLFFEAGKDAEARQQWTEAVKLDPRLYRSAYMLALSDKSLAQQSPAELDQTAASLQHVTELAPGFAPAFVELALIEWRRGRFQQAYKNAHQAETLEPWRVGYRTFVGHVLLAGNQPGMAANYARFAAVHAPGSDHNEAVLLWDEIAKANRGEGPDLALDLTPSAKMRRGRLTGLTCDAEPGTSDFTVTLQPDDSPTSTALTLHSKGNTWVGFSDSFWWGRDHFSRCFHMADHPALVTYRPSGPASGELVDLQITEDYPRAALGGRTAAQTSVAGTTNAAPVR